MMFHMLADRGALALTLNPPETVLPSPPPLYGLDKRIWRATPIEGLQSKLTVRRRQARSSSGPASSSSYANPYPEVSVGLDLPPNYDHVGPAPPKHRRAGVVLHPTSLPGPYGCGEIGAEACRFVDWLVDAGMQLWQVLPLVPPEREYWSPYSGLDALCGNTLLIPLDGLVDLALLESSELPSSLTDPTNSHANFTDVFEIKFPLLNMAAKRLLTDSRFEHLQQEALEFRLANPWVEESALFSVLTSQPTLEGLAWWDWPVAIRSREPDTINALRLEYRDDIDVFIALQYLFDRFWREVKSYANGRGISIVGDMPIYVGGQSADVWANQKLFELGEDGAPALVSGVPPDAFSDTGQLWGSPLYDWNAHAADGYKWWIQRFQRSLDVYDETRVDHFRAFAGYWAVESWRENGTSWCCWCFVPNVHDRRRPGASMSLSC